VNIREGLKAICPPVIWTSARKVFGTRGLYFDGDYSSWQEALDAAGGYDDPAILERVREAGFKVKRGEAVFERDSVCFYHEEYRWPPLACLLQIAARHDGILRVLDFGGSLGSFYIQHRKFFDCLKAVRWAVVEQPHYAVCGRKNFANERLEFYDSIDDCIIAGHVDVIFCSSVLQYLPAPYSILNRFSQVAANYLLIDRTPFIQDKKDRLTVQTIDSWMSKLPAWFFSEEKFNTNIMKAGYTFHSNFLCNDNANILCKYKGVYLIKEGII